MHRLLGVRTTQPRCPLLAVAVTFAAGAALAQWFDFPLSPLYGAVAMLALAALDRLRWLILPATFASALLLGTLAGKSSTGAELSDKLGNSWKTGHVVFKVDSEPSGSGAEWRFEGVLEQIDLDGQTFRLRCPIQVVWKGEMPRTGDVWQSYASVRNLAPPRNPGEFNAIAWFGSAGIHSELLVASDKDTRRLHAGGRWIGNSIASVRKWIESTLSTDIEGTREAALIRGMTIGLTDQIDQLLADEFRETGVFHLFSVSGLHVGLIALLIGSALSLIGLPRWLIAVGVIFAVIFFVLIAGGKAAGIRAGLMISVLALGPMIDRRPNGLNSLAAAALIILLFNPLDALNPGFQLSFAVVGSIILIGSPLQRWSNTLCSRDPFLPRQLVAPVRAMGIAMFRTMAATFAVSCSAFLGSLPLILFYFHLVSPGALVANLVAVPLSFVILGLALLTLAIGLVAPPLVAIFNNASFLVVAILTYFIQVFGQMPGSHRYVSSPLPADILAELTILDCGAGAASIIRTRGASWLIDSGSGSHGRRTVLPALRTRGINSLEGVVLTHGDADHLGGFKSVSSAVPVGVVYESQSTDRSPVRRNTVNHAMGQGIPIRTIGHDDILFASDRMEIRCLYPPSNLEVGISDDAALVLSITIADTQILMLSDSGLATEDWLLDHAREDVVCDVLVLGQHSSGVPTSLRFLSEASPKVVIKSSASFPSRETPSAWWESLLQQRGIHYLDMHHTGGITIRVSKSGLSYQSYLDAVVAE